ncbi:ImuA family protein [Schlesneria paludicola]|uniref:ImuA family protein n=1 Tax=Schlesneria paludicola TaxID=360056 RepID=UPI00029ABD2E|nr:hypothetical protein [Schlesneria paludicola]
MESHQHRAETLRALRQICRGTSKSSASNWSGRDSPEPQRLSTGVSALDELLPGQGLEAGWLIEWLTPIEGCGAAILALQGVPPAIEQRPVWAVIDPTGEFHPPAVQGWGISLEKILWLRPTSIADAAWTVEQCLRCPAVGITWFQADSLPDRVLQRWKIAVETGGGLGVLFRPAKAARYASWADLRWLIQPRSTQTSSTGAIAGGSSNFGHSPNFGNWRVQVQLLSCRGACHVGHAVELEVCDATGDVRLVSTVAHSTPAILAAGA